MGAQGLGSRAVLAALANRLEVDPGGWAGQIGMRFTSDQEIEEYKWLGKSPQMREWKGNRMAVGMRENGITLKNIPFEGTIMVKASDIRRDKFGQVLLRIGQLAQRANSHWAKLLSGLINSAESTPGYDGQNFFDTDHQEGDSGVLSNDLAAGDYSALNVAVATDPTADEMAKVIMAGLSHFYSLKDDVGEPINELAKQFLVMVPPRMFGPAQTAISAKLLASGSGSVDNPLQFQGVSINAVANPRLTATTKVVMFRTDAEDKPFILQEEKPLGISAKAEGSEYAHDTGHHEYSVDAERVAGYGLWQYAQQLTLS